MNSDVDLFSVVPSDAFRPLGSANRRLHWFAMKDLYSMLLEFEVDNAGAGTPRFLVTNHLQNVINRHSELWTSEEDDEEVAEQGASVSSVRANSLLTRYVKSGWLVVETRGYKDFFSMPYVVGHLVSSLLEIADDRPIATTGKLKQIRAGLQAVLEKPEENADTLQEIARDAVRLSRHLNNIRGAIKSHYDETLDSSLREIVDGFFDEYLPNVHSRAYMQIKTSENPLLIKNDILHMVNWDIRYEQGRDRLNKLLAGYQKNFGEQEAGHLLESDLHRLEIVFQNIPRQLDAIDELKSSYEKRVDTAIAYARLKPQKLEQRLQRLAKVLSDCPPETLVQTPVLLGELLGNERFPTPRRKRKPPEPRSLRQAEIDPAAFEKSRLERAARKAANCTEDELLQFIDKAMGDAGSLVLNELAVASIKDYFLMMQLHRIATGDEIDAEKNSDKRFSKLHRSYRFTVTEQFFQGKFVEMTKVIIQRR